MIGFGQISPGKLSKYHAHLEGLSNCTQCHNLGDKVSEQKCLDCHEPIKKRIQQKKGYHASSEVMNKTCISCHSEHHGINFEMVRFDKNTFDHNLTGYDLKGAHKKINCNDCHKPENISNIAIKLNKNTYLGLNPTCISCHTDPHQKTLGDNCAKCHNSDDFKPASNFDHNKTDFPLTGGHAQVECIACHKTETIQGNKFQHFSGSKFNSCNDCHKDPHQGSFGSDCKSCHTVQSFSKVKSNSNFNHSLTGFDLIGRHKVIDCKSCHDGRNGVDVSFKEFSGVEKIECTLCHKDVHRSKFGNDCLQCHSQSNFAIQKIPETFDHSQTDYSLEGKHNEVDCRACHKEKFMTAPMAFDACNRCHNDFHEGQFNHIENNDCRNCHDVYGFNESLFDLDRHQNTNFPLTGAHEATPCFMCHKPDEKSPWKFSELGKQCIDCHQNIHENFISEKYLNHNNCVSCHTDEAWNTVSFDHTQTAFALSGKHASTQCKSCHFKQSEGMAKQEFIGLQKECSSCHENIHKDQFEENGITDCKRCHGFENWGRSNFNHDNARFKLDGAHEKLDCQKCHFAELIEGKSIILYKNGKLDCKDCHEQ